MAGVGSRSQTQSRSDRLHQGHYPCTDFHCSSLCFPHPRHWSSAPHRCTSLLTWFALWARCADHWPRPPDKVSAVRTGVFVLA